MNDRIGIPTQTTFGDQAASAGASFVADGPAGVMTQAGVARTGPGTGPAMPAPSRVAEVPPELFSTLMSHLERVDGTALRMVAGGGIDLSGWVIRPRQNPGSPGVRPNERV